MPKYKFPFSFKKQELVLFNLNLNLSENCSLISEQIMSAHEHSSILPSQMKAIFYFIAYVEVSLLLYH